MSEVFPLIQSKKTWGFDPVIIGGLSDIADGFVRGIDAAGTPPAAHQSSVAKMRGAAQAMRDNLERAKQCAPMSNDQGLDEFTACLEGSNTAIDPNFSDFALELAYLSGTAGRPVPSVTGE